MTQDRHFEKNQLQCAFLFDPHFWRKGYFHKPFNALVYFSLIQAVNGELSF